MTPAPTSAWFLVGPTAAGKTAVAQRLAERRGALILSADSMLVYRGMDIGTAKPSPAERGQVPYLGLDCVTPDQSFSVGDYLQVIREGLARLGVAHRPCIVVGGTGLYISCLRHGLRPGAGPDPELRRRLESVHEAGGVVGLQAELDRVAPGRLASLSDPRNPRRLIRAIEKAMGGETEAAWSESLEMPPLAGLRWPGDSLARRIHERVEAMYRNGLLEEARVLRAAYPGLSRTAAQAIGYAEAWAYLDGRITGEEARARTEVRTRQLAKRQATWFRHQARVHWVEVTPGQSVDDMADAVEAQWNLYGPAPLQL